MTAPVTPAAPAVRAAPPSGRDGGGPDGAAPFAHALDGALTEDRGPIGDCGAGRSGKGEPERQPADAETAAAAPAELKATAEAAGMSAALWAIVLGAASAERPVADAAAAAVPGATVPGAAAPGAAVPGAVPVDGVPTTALPVVVAAAAGVPVADGPATGVVPTPGDQPTADGSTDIAVTTGPRASVPGLGAAAHAAKAAGEHPGAPVSALARAQGTDGAAGVGTGASAPAPVPGPVPVPDRGVTTPSVTPPAAAAVAGVAAADAAVLSGLTVVEAPAAATTGGAITGGPVDGSGAAAGGTAAPVAGAAGSLSAGAGGTGRDPGSSGSPATDGVTDVASAGQSTAPAAVAAPADADGATGPAAAQPVGTQVARQVAVLRGGPDGAHTMTLVLTPETLGPVEVEVTLTKGVVDLHLRGAHEQGRAALLDALPDLRRDLESAGLTCSRVEVDREAGGSWLERHAAQQQGAGEREGQPGRGDARSRPGEPTADSRNDMRTPASSPSTSSGVDVLA